jgi:RNA polymerase sigma-70 factor, ECF subfamily
MPLPSSQSFSSPSVAAESQAWVDALSSSGRERDEAVARLHELLLRGARFEVSRRRASLAHIRGEDFDDVAMQAADDALVAVLGKLDDYRGAGAARRPRAARTCRPRS